MNSNTNKGTLQSLLRPRIKHLWSHRRSIRIPTDKHKLGRGTTIIRLKFNVDQSVTTVVFGKLLDEILVCLAQFPLLFNDDCLFVFDFVDEVTEFVRLLSELELLEGSRNFVVDGNTGSLGGWLDVWRRG